MSQTFLFYAYWNGAQVRDLFEGLVSITSGSSFGELAAVLSVTGLLLVLAAGAVKSEGKGVIVYFACAVLFWFAVILPKAPVTIQDIRTQTVYRVDNVPLGLAFFGSMANRAGYWLTEAYETAFAPVSVARFSKFGAVYPERVVEVLQKTGPVTVEGKAALDAVIRGCIVPELITDETKAAALTKSVDLWTDVNASGWVNPARTVAMNDGTVKRCPEALTAVQDILTNVELPALKNVLGTKLAPDHADPSGVIASAIPQAESLLLGLSRTMDVSLRHALMLSAVPAGVASHAATTEGPLTLAVGLAKAQGNLAGEINYRTMARIAEEALPKIRNALEFTVIALFPVIALIALVSGAGMTTVVRSYLTILVTVQVWPAVSSVVNYLMIAYDAHPFGVIASQFGGNSLQAAALIRETGATSQAIAGALMCAVPVISYALVRAGDVAVGQLVGGLTAPVQGAAASLGASLAAGNVSQGNVSVGNVTANNLSSNKSDASVRAVDSGMLVTQSGFGSVTRTPGGMVTGMTRTPVDFGVSASMSQSYVRGHTASNVSQTSTVRTDAAQFSFSESAGSSDSTQRNFAHALRDAMNTERALGTTDSSASSLTVTLGWNQATELGGVSSVSEGTRLSSGGRLRAIGEFSLESAASGGSSSQSWIRSSPSGLSASPSSYVLGTVGERVASGSSGAMGGIGGVLSNGLNMLSEKGVSANLDSGLTFDEAQSLVDNATSRSGSSTGMSSDEAYQLVRSASDRVASTHGDARVREAALSFRQSLDSTHTASRDTSTALSESVSAVGNLSQARSAQMQTSVDQGVAVMQRALEHYGTPEAALQAMYQSGEASGFAGENYADAVGSVSPQDAFGPGTMVSAVERNADVFEAAGANVEKAVATNAAEVGAISVGTLDGTVTDEAMSTSPLEGSGSFENQYGSAFVRGHKTRVSAEGDMAFRRGILMVASEAYQMENKDKNFAIRNAFFGAWGYRSGDEIQEDMMRRSEAMPELRQKLTEMGRSSETKPTTRDWEALVRLARQPRGIRP